MEAYKVPIFQNEAFEVNLNHILRQHKKYCMGYSNQQEISWNQVPCQYPEKRYNQMIEKEK